MNISLKDVCILSAVLLGYAVVSMVMFLVSNTTEGMIMMIIMGVGVLLFGQLELFRRLQFRMDQIEVTRRKERSYDYHQLEALHGLYNTLNISTVLPQMRDWVISPDFAVLLIDQIRANRPNVIVEASSGVSTLVSGYCVKELGHGKVVSMDHDAEYAAISRKNVAKHGLDDVAKVQHAALVQHSINGDDWKWYDLSVLEDVDVIDMLVIDGPPQDVQSLSRYPALPLLLERLSEDAIIILDDAGRDDEREIVRRWLTEFPDFEERFIDTEKGTVILNRRLKK